MLTYLLLSGPGIAARDRATLDEQVRGAAPSVLLQAAEPSLWADGSGSCLLWTWQSATEKFGGSHVVADERGVVALAGSAWSRTAWATAGSLASEAPLAPAAVRDELTGSFSALSVGADGHGFVTTDDTGTGHVYVARSPDVWAVSNRAPLAAVGLDGRWEPDVDSLAWLPMLAQFAGTGTSVRGVELLPAASAVLVRPGVVPEIEVGTTPWAAGAFSGVSESEALDGAAHALVQRASSVASSTVGSPVVQLSGGKDSRLVLAALRGAGVAGDVRFRTMGLPGAADREVATLLGSTYDLDLQVVEPSVDTGPSAAGLDQLVRRHVFQTAGMFGAWDLKGVYPDSSELKLTGLFGELMRTTYKTEQPLARADEAVEHLLTRMAWDKQQLLRPHVRSRLDDALQAWAADRLGHGWAPDSLLDLFYAEVRIGRWVGGAEEANSLNPTANLLQLSECVVAGFAHSHVERSRDALHYRLIERLDPYLLEVPLAVKDWHAALAEPGSRTNPTPVPSLVEGSESWQIRGWKAHRHVIAAELLASDNPMHEVLDPDRLEQVLVRGRSPRRIAQLHGAWAASVWASGGYEVFPWNGPAVPATTAPSRQAAATSFSAAVERRRAERRPADDSPAGQPSGWRSRVRRALSRS